MPAIHANGKTFSVECDPIEVTSLSRPDEGWEHVDSHGHVHQWEWPDGRRVYQPGERASLPTCKVVIVVVEHDEDGEEYYINEHQCIACGDVVTPRNKPDDCRQFVPGLRVYYINDYPVTREEFEREAREAGFNIGGGY